MKITSVCAMMHTEVIFMECYYCEKELRETWLRFDSGIGVCEACLCHIGLCELLELLKMDSFVNFLKHYGIAQHHTANGY